jgi:ferric-dicitrate binding protein FerR (iron transport regulator)
VSERRSHEADPVPDPVLARALEALPAVQADAAFEARLRGRFLRGEDETAGSQPPAATSRRRLVLLPALALLAAAAVVVVFFLARPDEGPAWELMASSRGEVVHVDDLPYPVARPEALRAALARGGTVRTDEETHLRLRLGETLALEIGAQSEVRLPRPPRAGSPPPLFSTLRGHLSIATGPGLAGRRLLVRAPELEVEVVGTRFAVDVSDKGTCVCCTEGTVEVRSLALSDQLGQVQGGAMAFGLPDGNLMFAEMVIDEHVEPLGELGATWP